MLTGSELGCIWSIWILYTVDESNLKITIYLMTKLLLLESVPKLCQEPWDQMGRPSDQKYGTFHVICIHKKLSDA